MSDTTKFMYEGESLEGRCGYCQRTVDNYDWDHRVTSIMHGGRGVECVLRGDIERKDAAPLTLRIRVEVDGDE